MRRGRRLPSARDLTGGSIGISRANNVFWNREQFHQSRLVGLVNPSTVQYRHTLKQAKDYFVAQGSSLAHAQQQAFGRIGQQVQTQAACLDYVEVF
jgi:DHA2 family multidrug resistance protein